MALIHFEIFFCTSLTNYRRIILSAFFYGNGVLLYTTLALVKAYTPCFNLADSYAIIHLFTGWDKSPTARSHEGCFNLILNEMRDHSGGKINTFLDNTGVPISVQRHKGFDGLKQEIISRITSRFRQWYCYDSVELTKSKMLFFARVSLFQKPSYGHTFR